MPHKIPGSGRGAGSQQAPQANKRRVSASRKNHKLHKTTLKTKTVADPFLFFEDGDAEACGSCVDLVRPVVARQTDRNDVCVDRVYSESGDDLAGRFAGADQNQVLREADIFPNHVVAGSRQRVVANAARESVVPVAAVGHVGSPLAE